MSSLDLEALVSGKVVELAARPVEGWAACASILSRVLVLSSPGWTQWPGISETISEAYYRAMHRSVDLERQFLPDGELIARLEDFHIEDDGSTEWNYSIDLMEMIQAVISGQGLSVCLETVLRVYLEGMFNTLARAYADERGCSISQFEAEERAAVDPAWRRVVQFVESLLSMCLPSRVGRKL